ncbi:MAG: hypothetical protein ABIH26_06960 [Candidatus Eisenbacteria bacterium]
MRDRRFWIAIASAVLLPAILLWAGCGGKEPGEKAAEEMVERMIEKSGGEDADVDVDEGKITMKSKDYEMESAEATEWPDDLPGDVPRFSYGKVERIARMEAKAEGARSFNIWLRDVDADAASKYMADLEKAGWETMQVDMGDKGGMVSGQKGEIAVNFMHSKEESRGHVVVTSEK